MTEWISVTDRLPEPFKQVIVKLIILSGSKSSIGTWIGIDSINDHGIWGYSGKWYGTKENKRWPFRIPPQFWQELPKD